ncbi:MAG TPA: hypothetical protein VIJ39_04415 [Solirubrobacteraceae bacterium]
MFYTDGAQSAARLVLLTADADEISVGAAVAFGVVDDQPTSANTAVDTALEIVRMLALLLTSQVLGAKHLLNLLPRLMGYKLGVLAGVENPLIAHQAHVVGVAQQPV